MIQGQEKSKNRMILIIVLLSTLVVVLCGIFAIRAVHEKFRFHFFDGWKPEAQVLTADVLYDSRVIRQGKRSGLDDVDNATPLAIYQDRVYYLSQHKASEPRHRNIKIFSVNESGLDRKEHYSGDILGKELKIVPSQRVYAQYPAVNTGLLVYDGKIIIKNAGKVIEYNICEDSLYECEDTQYTMPLSSVWFKLDGEKIIAGDRETGIQYKMTLSDIAERNPYAGSISEYAEEEMWNGNSPVSDVVEYYVFEDRLYLVGEIRNHNGHAYAVVFSCDAQTGEVSYISNIYTDDTVCGNHRLIPVIQD